MVTRCNSLGWSGRGNLVGTATGCQSFKNSLQTGRTNAWWPVRMSKKRPSTFTTHELYSTVALDERSSPQGLERGGRSEVYRNAIDRAIRAGNLMAAVAMSDTLIGAGLGDQQDWNQRVNLALNLGNDARHGPS